MRKAVATVAVVCGLGLVVVPFALSLFDRAAAGERVTNRFRDTMSTQGLHQLATKFGDSSSFGVPRAAEAIGGRCPRAGRRDQAAWMPRRDIWMVPGGTRPKGVVGAPWD
jgi:hypothetical protein